jgi:hypothetical protein
MDAEAMAESGLGGGDDDWSFRFIFSPSNDNRFNFEQIDHEYLDTLLMNNIFFFSVPFSSRWCLHLQNKLYPTESETHCLPRGKTESLLLIRWLQPLRGAAGGV